MKKYPIIKIDRGEGIYLYDDKGTEYIDAVSSWWVNLFGHNNPRLKDAIKNQLDKLEHVIFAGLTHDPALELTDSLLSITPDNMTKVFYADIGSAAVESAMKLSFGYRKKQRHIIKKNASYTSTTAITARRWGHSPSAVNSYTRSCTATLCWIISVCRVLTVSNAHTVKHVKTVMPNALNTWNKP